MPPAEWRPFCLSFVVLNHCGLVIPYGYIDQGQPDGTKPLPEPILTHHQWVLMALWLDFSFRCPGSEDLSWRWCGMRG